ncbi:MAG: heavy metal-associated domain-containing protein [Polaromonas sp.]
MTAVIQIEIENLKCGGCEKSILSSLKKIPGISDVKVERARQIVQFAGPAHLRALVIEKLLSMGYPEKRSVSGLHAGVVNAKSFVSCAIGRLA